MTRADALELAAPFAFVDGALDRADRVRDDPDALAALWSDAGVVSVDGDGRTWADVRGAPDWPRGGELGDVADAPGLDAAVFLGLDRDGRGWFALDAARMAWRGAQRIDLRSAATTWPAFDATAFAQARALMHWHARHRFCGVCGQALAFVRAGWLGRCTGCALEHYPRTDPAMIVAVCDGRRLLLGRQASWPDKRWSVLAGFVEPGETLEQTVAREVLEETGVRVRSCRYLTSQPWPFPGALMLGFMADAEADTPIAGDELEDARWFDVEQVRAGLRHDWRGPAPEGDAIAFSQPLSISRWLIEHWLAHMEAAGGDSRRPAPGA